MAHRKIGYKKAVVSFIDILGFRQLIKNHDALDVHNLLSQLSEFSTPISNSHDIKDSEVRGFHSIRLSDAIVRIRLIDPVERNGEFLSEIREIKNLLIKASINDISLRGAVTIGDIFVEDAANGPIIFGPALARAYDMETNEAIYPRIVIDDSALIAHREAEDNWLAGHTFEDEQQVLDHLLRTSDEGIAFIDYIDCFCEADSIFSFIEYLRSYRLTIIHHLKSSKDHSRVYRKYVWLKNYYNQTIQACLKGNLNDEFSELWATRLEEEHWQTDSEMGRPWKHVFIGLLIIPQDFGAFDGLLHSSFKIRYLAPTT